MEATYQILCKANDLDEDQMIVVEIEGISILVTKINGDFYAVENKCTHESLALSGGQISENQIHCPHHGARFDLKTGKATQFPAVVDLKSYSVKVENDNVLAAL
ncbi:MAG: non-heme iron oxygenase ferredoxin subunit [candidate division Zixibacteria bacterium]|nr:non-heme iron oxygenase ferredoxin subunit [candidate division Zixibacteria bacterium]